MRIGIVGFAFGTPSTLLSNRTLGNRVLFPPGYHQRLRANLELPPVFTQQHLVAKAPKGRDVSYISEDLRHPPPTLRIARAAAHWILKNGITSVDIVCAGPHHTRCERDLLLALEEIVPPELTPEVSLQRGLLDMPQSTWFRKESGQWWTRNVWLWCLREALLLIMPVWLYKRLAG